MHYNIVVLTDWKYSHVTTAAIFLFLFFFFKKKKNTFVRVAETLVQVAETFVRVTERSFAMQAVRIHPSSSQDAEPYSVSNPAPSSSLTLDRDVPIPQPKRPGQILVRVHAATVTRDELTWPETYGPEYPILGHDVSGVVAAVYGEDEDASGFRSGDEVYGLVDVHLGSTWAEFAIGDTTGLAPKPKNLSWAESVTVPMSGLTAWQALFEKAGLSEPDFEALQADKRALLNRERRSVLVTGAAGAVGAYVVQLAALVGLHVVAASSSTERNGEFLKSLGAAETVNYNDMNQRQALYDFVIDTVGGQPLAQSWSLIADTGSLISVDSASFAFHKNPPPGKEHVKALFFIVESRGEQLRKMSRALELGFVKPFLAQTFPLEEARAAYEKASGRLDSRGKVVLTM